MFEDQQPSFSPNGTLTQPLAKAPNEQHHHERHPGRRVAADELLGNPTAPVQFIVDDLIPVGVTTLFGRPKSGKSLLSIDLAVSVALGHDFLDRPTHHGSVLYFALEDGKSRYAQRLQARTGTERVDNIDIVFDGVTGVDDFLLIANEWLCECTAPRLVIVDLYGHIAPRGRDTNDNNADYTTLQQLQDFAHTHKLAVVLIHHTRKDSQHRAGVSGTPHATTITGAYDNTLVLSRGEGSNARVLSTQGRAVTEAEIHLLLDVRSSRAVVTKVEPRQAPYAQHEVLTALCACFRSPNDVPKVTGQSADPLTVK